MKNDSKASEKRKKQETLLEKKKGFRLVGLALVISAVFLASGLIFRDGEAVAKKLAGSQVMDKVNYKSRNVAMAPVEAVVSGNMIEVPLDAVKEKKLISFVYSKKGNPVPLMAYITPSGKLITAISMCEPCRSTKFHIEGNNMVCNACFTRWDLESLEGISGGCLKYPPDVISHTIQGKKIMIKETDILNWKPRV